MGLEQRSYEEQVYAKGFKHITSAATAAYTLTKLQRTTIVDATNSSGDITVKLPPADQCFGMIFVVKLTTKATSDVLVTDWSAENTLFTLDTSGDDVVAYCDGQEWYGIGGTYT